MHSSWTPNTDLKPLDKSQHELTANVQKNKKLVAAYELAKQMPPLSHFKNIVQAHQDEMKKWEQQFLEEEAKQAAESERKQKKKEDKEKRKSLTKTPKKKADRDEMEVDSDAEEESAPKSSTKKRKADATDGEKVSHPLLPATSVYIDCAYSLPKRPRPGALPSSASSKIRRLPAAPRPRQPSQSPSPQQSTLTPGSQKPSSRLSSRKRVSGLPKSTF